MFPDGPVYAGNGFAALNTGAGSIVTATVTYDGKAEDNQYDLVLTGSYATTSKDSREQAVASFKPVRVTCRFVSREGRIYALRRDS